jgi:hypothetical protein
MERELGRGLPQVAREPLKTVHLELRLGLKLGLPLLSRATRRRERQQWLSAQSRRRQRPVQPGAQSRQVLAQAVELWATAKELQ